MFDLGVESKEIKRVYSAYTMIHMSIYITDRFQNKDEPSAILIKSGLFMLYSIMRFQMIKIERIHTHSTLNQDNLDHSQLNLHRHIPHKAHWHLFPLPIDCQNHSY
jgi:hypothetical protein